MTSKIKMSKEGVDLLKAVEQIKTRKKGRVYTTEQLLAISARQSVNRTQKEFARLLTVHDQAGLLLEVCRKREVSP